MMSLTFNIDESQRFHQIVKLKASSVISVIPTIRYYARCMYICQLGQFKIMLRYIPYSGLFLRGKIFTNWPYLMFSWENFHASLRALSAY